MEFALRAVDYDFKVTRKTVFWNVDTWVETELMVRPKFQELSVPSSSWWVTGREEPGEAQSSVWEAGDSVMADHTAKAQGEDAELLAAIKDKQSCAVFEIPASARAFADNYNIAAVWNLVFFIIILSGFVGCHFL